MSPPEVPNPPARILVVDDVPQNLRLLATELGARGYEVRCAISGELALAAASAEPPDVILLDVRMPHLDGCAVCDCLKSAAATCEIPVLFLSAFDDAAEKVRAFQCGAVDYITKPLQIEEVLVRIEHQLALQAARRDLRQLNADLERRVRDRAAELAATYRELDRSEDRFRQAILNAPYPIAILTEDGEILQVNRVWCELSGYAPEELPTLAVWVERAYERERQPPIDAMLEHLFAREARADSREEVALRTRAGDHRYWLLSSAPLGRLADGRRAAIAMAVDVTDRRESDRRLRYLAYHDALTGLGNRTLLFARLDEELSAVRQGSDTDLALLFVDLDRFKPVNDSLGHAASDRLLAAVAQAIARNVRAEDTVARVGGDEFAVLLVGANRAAASETAARIAEVLQQPFELLSRPVYIRASIGIALGAAHYTCGEDFLRDADLAMYRAKQQHDCDYVVFRPSMYAAARQRLQLENDLQRALRENELRLHLQPIAAIASGELQGFEALVRWQHPERGMVLPGEFIPVAEDTGAILTLGEWVLWQTCALFRDWQQRYPQAADLYASVNLSLTQVYAPGFLETVERVLATSGLPGCSLTLELTESTLMSDTETAIALLQELRAREIGIAIDDFGTGYSSLSYLHRLPASAIKVDRSFVSRLGVSTEATEIVRTILWLARQLDLTTVAEGIETREQAELLRGWGCHFAQGYLLARPLEIAQVEALLAAEQSLRYVPVR